MASLTIPTPYVPNTQIIPKTAGLYWKAGASVATSATQAATQNTTYYTPIYLDGRTTFDRIGIRSGTTFPSSSISVRVGIYNNSANNLPSTVYLDAGTVVAATTSTEYLATISITPPAGFYWLAANLISAVTTQVWTGLGTGSNAYIAPLSNGISSNAEYSYYTESVNATSGFATAGTLTNGRTVAILPALRIA